MNNQIKETNCTINLQYYLLQAAGRGSLVSWAGTKKACDVYGLISAYPQLRIKAYHLGFVINLWNSNTLSSIMSF